MGFCSGVVQWPGLDDWERVAWLARAVASALFGIILHGKKAADLYAQAFVQSTQARALYQESEDAYYRANDAASYDDWRRARPQWDCFYNRHQAGCG